MAVNVQWLYEGIVKENWSVGENYCSSCWSSIGVIVDGLNLNFSDWLKMEIFFPRVRNDKVQQDFDVQQF